MDANVINPLPYVYFGGKRKIAHVVWERLGNVKAYIEPFFGGGAVFWLRPPEHFVLGDRQWDLQNTGGLGIAIKQGDMLDVPTCPIADLPGIMPILPETPSWTWEQVTLIKMDVEGGEYDILEHLPYRVPQIVGEYHLTGSYNSHEVAQNALQSFLPGYTLEFSFDTVHPLGLFFANLSPAP